MALLSNRHTNSLRIVTGSEAIVMFFICLIYSAAEPALILLAVLYMAGNYVVDKHALIHLSKTPPMLDERVAKWTEKILPLALLGHAILGFMV